MKKVLCLLAVMGLSLVSVNYVKGEDVITTGKVVSFDYTLTVKGQVVDTSEGKQPLEYTQGQKMIIPGLEKQMEGMKVGDEKTVTIIPEEAYGPVDPKLVVEVAKTNFDPSMAPQVGMVIQMQTPEGQVVPGVVKEIKDTGIMVDFNHPLAGEELTFKVKVVSIK